MKIRPIDYDGPGEEVWTEDHPDFNDHYVETDSWVWVVGEEHRWEFVPEQDNVQHPSHYTSHPSGVETIEITKHESFLRGNLLKYVLRAPYKGSELEDMKKAQQYLQWEIERLQETAS